MYLYVMALMRLNGKRTLGDLSPIDFVITVLIGDLFDDVFWAEVPLAHGLVAVTTLVLVDMLVSFAISKSPLLERIVGSSKVPVIQDGRILEANLRREQISRDELLSLARMKQKDEDELRGIREANLEPNAQLSILECEDARPVQKQDLPALKELFR
jgi:uncharacterized membrane protein YcaP (DUF421 family)